MAYAVSFDETYEAGRSYAGECDHFTCELTGPPGMRGIIKAAVKAWFAVQGHTLLRFRLMQDTEPFFDKYQIDIWAHGSVIAWAILVAAIAAIAGIAIVWYGVVAEDWNPTDWLKYAAIGAVALAVIAVTRKK